MMFCQSSASEVPSTSLAEMSWIAMPCVRPIIIGTSRIADVAALVGEREHDVVAALQRVLLISIPGFEEPLLDSQIERQSVRDRAACRR